MQVLVEKKNLGGRRKVYEEKNLRKRKKISRWENWEILGIFFGKTIKNFKIRSFEENIEKFQEFFDKKFQGKWNFAWKNILSKKKKFFGDFKN